jgi:Tannase and feruloyl esterase
MKQHILFGAVSALSMVLAACSSTPTVVRPSLLHMVDATLACDALTGLAVPATVIGLPTQGARVLVATEIKDTDASGAVRAYCKVTGQIQSVDTAASPIRFQINLPRQWNQRALQFGGGGTNGRVVTADGASTGAPVKLATPLARGYVTLGSDSGHDATTKPPFDTSFALNQEELMNFAQWQIKKTLDVARHLVLLVYGQKPAYVYFAGGSQGGHEAFDAAQRYPDDYDGIIAQYPAYNVINMWLGAQAQAQAVYGRQLGVASPSWLSPAKVAYLVDHVRAECDVLDGLVDGIIGNVAACNARVTPQTLRTQLRCPEGKDNGGLCLSDHQLEAVEKIASPVQFDFRFADGSSTYPRWPILEGATFAGVEHLGKAPVADVSKLPFGPDGSAFQLFPAKGGIQGFITRDAKQDPLAFEPKQWASRIQQVSAWTDASSTDLRRFAVRGGKMLMTHGSIDDSISPHNSIAYWERLQAANGSDAVRSFARFYLIPGYGHGNGLFKSAHDWLGTLERWVEQGQAPEKLVTMDDNNAERSKATNGRTRPLCEYGSYPRYTGPSPATQSQANNAEWFTCTRQ